MSIGRSGFGVNSFLKTVERALVLFECVIHRAEIVQCISIVWVQPDRIVESLECFLVTAGLVQARAKIVEGNVVV